MSFKLDRQYKERALRKYGDLSGELHIVELIKTATRGLGLSLAGNKNLTTMSVYVVNILPDSSAALSGEIKIGDELLEINGLPLYGRSHLNASPIVKSITEPKVNILLLRSSTYIDNLAVIPQIECPCPRNKNGMPSTLIDKNVFLTNLASKDELKDNLSNDTINQADMKMSTKKEEHFALSVSHLEEAENSLNASKTQPSNCDNFSENNSNFNKKILTTSDDDVFVNNPVLANNSHLNSYNDFNKSNHMHNIVIEIPHKLPMGIHIIGGSDSLLKKHFVHEIYTNGAASKEGNLQVGDEIIEINGESLTGKSQCEAQEILRTISSSKKLVLAQNECSEGTKNLSTSPSNKNSCRASSGDSIDRHIDIVMETKQIVLTKRPMRPLGFVISTSHNDSRIVVTDILKGFAAEADGLMPQDEILSINNQPIQSLSFAHVVSLLKISMGHISLQIRRIQFDSTSHRLSFRKSLASPNFEMKKSRSFRNRGPLPACLKAVD